MRFIANGIDFPDELLRAQDEGRTVFFCGAGVSMAKAGLPDFNSLTLQVLDELGALEDNNARRLFEVAQRVEREDGIVGLATADRIFGQLRRSFDDTQIGEAVAACLRTSDDVDLSAHKTVRKLATLQTGETRLITTNFDLLFERAGKKLKSATRSSLPHIEFNESDWGIVHLHGMLNRECTGPTDDGFVLSSAEFGDAYLALGWAREFVKKVLDRYVAVFVGYSADDPPIRYLLEGLQQSSGLKNRAYAFQATPDDEAVAAWDEKGVEAVTFSLDDGGYDNLWDSLEAWVERSRDAVRWRQKILNKAKKGPRSLTPHERGMVAHIVSTQEGAKAFSSVRPPLPAEWLCVFDPAVRFGEPASISGRFSEGPIVDPHPRYRLDSDPPPRTKDDQSPHAGRIPERAWSAIEASPNDLRSLEHYQVSSIRGRFAQRTPGLPLRVAHLASWIANVASEPACAWWAGQQHALHPEIIRRLTIERARANAGKTKKPVSDAWKTIREYHALQATDRDQTYELRLEAKSTGWHEPLAREYAALFEPYLKLSPVWRRPVPPDGRTKITERDLVQVSVEYFSEIRTVDVPDEYILPLIPKLRNGLRLAADLEARYSYAPDICSIEPDERGPDEGDDTFHREYGLSGHVLHFVELFKRLIQIDRAQAETEVGSWDESSLVFRRLKVWASGNLDLVSPDVFGALLLKLDDEAFWPFKGDRDLLLGLAKNWANFSDEQRKALGQRILKGPPKHKSEKRDRHVERSAHQSLNRIHWLSEQGCRFRFDLDRQTARLRTKAPRWRPEYALSAARAHDGGGGWVRTETSFDDLLNLAPEEIIPHVQTIERRPVDRLVEYNPFLGLSTERPDLALQALIAETESRDEFNSSFWNTFLRLEPRKDDTAAFSTDVGKALLSVSDHDFAEIALSASDWFEKKADSIRQCDSSVFEALWNKFIAALTSEEEAGSSALVRDEDVPDWSTEAINSPAGNLAELLISNKGQEEFEAGERLPQSWTGKAEELLALPGDSRRFALVIFGFDLRFLYYVDPEWTEAKLLSVLGSDEALNPDAEALWAGFFWRAHVPQEELFERLKPHLVSLLDDQRQQKSHHVEILAGIILAGWSAHADGETNRIISDSEFRAFILRASPAFRRNVLWTLDRWSDDGNDWSKNIPDFLQNVWPKQKSIRSKEISARLVDLALSQKSNFPEVAKLVAGLVSKVDDDRLFVPELRQSEDAIASRYPAELLDLLHAVLPESAALWPFGAAEALEVIGKTKPALRTTSKYIELKSRIG